MSPQYVYILITFILFSFSCRATPYVLNNDVILVDKKNNIKVLVNISIPTDKETINCDYWGTGVINKECIIQNKISNIIIEIGNKEVFMAASAYLDLVNIKIIKLKDVKENSFIIYIRGGDAAASYTAYILIENFRLKWRRVESGEFSTEWWEETIYSWVPDDGR
jgi:hypothetical protein